MSKNYMNDSQASEIVKYISDTMKFPIMGAGGGFAPIGKEGYIDGTLAPQGWLICDGSTYNIADYPDLAAYYASHHGASNYYGGDGITTFAVPVRNGMPTSGVDSPDEHIVGEWRETVDGVLKKKPVYERSLVGYLGDHTWDGQSAKRSDTDITSWNIDYLLFAESVLITTDKTPQMLANERGSLTYSWVNSNIVYLTVYTDDNQIPIGTPYKLTAKYTKSTDSWQTVQEGHSADGNGIFCVKATLSGDANAHQYSTEEQVVGKWIDGSDIYEKTLVGLTFNATGFTEVPHNINNLREVIDLSGRVKRADGWQFPLPCLHTSGEPQWGIGCNGVSETAISFNVGTGNTGQYTLIQGSLSLTIQYTKTQ